MWWRATSSISSGESDRELMTVRRLAAVDAQSYWMSAKVPNDAFLLYGFAGVPDDLEQAIGVILGRAADCAELRLRIREGSALTYPAWVGGSVDADRISVHALRRQQLGGAAWRRSAGSPTINSTRGCGRGECTSSPLSRAYPPSRDRGRWPSCRCLTPSPTASGHRRWRRDCSVERSTSRPVPTPRLRGVTLPWRSLVAARAHRQLVRDTDAGLVPPQAPTRPCAAQQCSACGGAKRAHPDPAPRPTVPSRP